MIMNEKNETGHRDVPLLMQLPKQSKWNKENKLNNLKLLKLPMHRKDQKEAVTLTRLPLDSFCINQPHPTTTRQTYNMQVPKLINLKPVFQKHMINLKSHEPQNKFRKEVPQLIRLPKLISHPNLLETPRKTVKNPPKDIQKAPAVPILTDLRQLSPKPTTQFLVNPTEKSDVLMEKKAAPVRETYDEQLSSPIMVATREGHKSKHNYIESSSGSPPRHHRKHKNREDELYDVISELLVKRKNRRKRRRLKLFDILDNIPVTSEEESESELENLQPLRRKKSKETVPNLGLVFLPEKEVNDPLKETKKNSWVVDKSSGLPNPPNVDLKPSSGINGSQLSKISKYFDPCNKEVDPMSWINIIKMSRNETKETQTDKRGLSAENVINKEIQTELKEMIEIPKSVTFLSPTINNNDDKTKEFCERVRKEVIAKLTEQSNMTKHSQASVTNSGVQTSPPPEAILSSETPKESFEQVHHLTLDPVIFQQIEYKQPSSIEIPESKKFLDVVDVETDNKVNYEQPSYGNVQCDNPKSSDSENKQLNPKILLEDSRENQYPITTTEKEELPSEAQLHNRRSSTPDLGSPPQITVSTHSQDEVIPKGFRKDGDVSTELLKTGIIPTSIESVGLKINVDKTANRIKNRPTAFKSNIKGNLEEFSVGLQALEDLQENLERELQQSKLLFNTIATLQEGFAPDVETQHQAETNYRTNSSRYVIRNDKTEEQLDDNGDVDDKVINGYFIDSPESNNVEELDAKYVKDFPPNIDFEDKTDNSDGKLFSDYPSKAMTAIERAREDTAFSPRRAREDAVFSPRRAREDAVFSPRRAREDDAFSPRSIIKRNRGVLTPRSLHNTSSVKFSLETKNDELEESEMETDMEHRSRIENENILREEIRKRITNPVSEEEIQAKQENSKRSNLLNWMRGRQQEQLRKYKQDIQEKRTTEHRPFLSQRTVTKTEIDETMKERADLKRALLEETNAERLNAAERLAYDVISKSNDIRHGAAKKFINNRYTKRAPASLVRETRASRMRKNALIRDVARHAARLSRVESKRKPKSANVSLIGGGFKTRDIDTRRRLKSSKASRRSMEGEMTDNMDDYYTDEHLTRPYKLSYKMPADELVGDYGGASLTKSNQSSVDRLELRKILTEYGVNNSGSIGDGDDKLFERKTSITNLLAEVDLALLTDNTEVSTNSQTIDWNEIDNILNE